MPHVLKYPEEDYEFDTQLLKLTLIMYDRYKLYQRRDGERMMRMMNDEQEDLVYKKMQEILEVKYRIK